MELEQMIRTITRIPGPSGYEERTGKWITEQFRPFVDEVQVSPMQCVIAKVGTKGPKVMISAHQDEIALFVTKIEDDGAVRICANGGVDPRILPALEVEIQAKSGAIYGVIGAKTPHAMTAEEVRSNADFDTLYVDTGFSAEQVKQLVRVGDPVVMLAEPQILADGGMASKTMDDRASVMAMLVAAEELSRMKVDMQVYFVASTQEEVGAYGAKTAAGGIHPDWAIAIDVTHGEGPGTAPFEAFPLDKIVIERGSLIHKALGRKMEDTAKKYHIPFNIGVSGGRTYTDADEIQRAGGGIPTALLSIPLRYMHTTVETLKLDVVRDAGRLMAMTIADMAADWEAFKWC